MKNPEQNQNERQYYIDWLRILLILSVFLFHVGMIFNTWDWHVKNDVRIVELKNVMTFLHYWRIPLLFLVSGAGTYFALGIRTPGQYLKERFKRLLIPGIAGIFLLVPIQVYLDTNLAGRMAKYASLFEFYPHMFEGIYPIGNFSWHHLYFIFYLFLIALIVAPLLKFFRSERFAGFMKWLEKIVTRPFGLNVFLIPLILSQVILRPFFPDETHDLVHDWASIAFYLVFFLAGYMLLSNKNIVASIGKYRYLYFIQTVLVTAFMFKVPYMVNSERTGEILWDLGSILVAWSASVTAIGFAQRYLNRDTKFKKLANEAIYPFYLLHQPVIVVVGYYIVQWDISVWMKVVMITLFSLMITVSIYWFLIRSFNALRVIFGMKSLNQENIMTINLLKKNIMKTKLNTTIMLLTLCLVSISAKAGSDDHGSRSVHFNSVSDQRHFAGVSVNEPGSETVSVAYRNDYTFLNWAPVTSGEADFEDIVPGSASINLVSPPSVPGEATFEDEYISGNNLPDSLIRSLAPITPKEASFDEDIPVILKTIHL